METSVARQKRHQCPRCPKSYTRPFSLKNHQRIHEDSRPFQCSIASCPKAFFSSDHRKKHEATHSAVKTKACIDCGKSFLRSGDLNRHLRTARHMQTARAQPSTAAIQPPSVGEENTVSLPASIAALSPPFNLMDEASRYFAVDWAEQLLRDAVRDGTWQQLFNNIMFQPPDFYQLAWTVAAQEGSIEFLQYLSSEADATTSPDPEGHLLNHALVTVSTEGHHKALLALLALGANVNFANVDGVTPLFSAIMQGHYACTVVLIEHGANVDQINEDGQTLPMIAASNDCDFDIFAELFWKSTHSILQKDNEGRSLIHHASMSETGSQYLHFVLDAGAHSLAQTYSGKTALHIACESLNIEFISVLLRRDQLLINHADKDLRTPLHTLCIGKRTSKSTERTECIRLLVDRCADVNAIDVDGKTPLISLFTKDEYSFHYTDTDDRVAIVEFLLARGAEVNVVNRKGRTVLDALMRLMHNILRASNRKDFLMKFRGLNQLRDLCRILPMLIEKNARRGDDISDGEAALGISGSSGGM